MRHLEDFEHQFLELLAKEIRAWAQGKAEDRLIVVTSNEHESSSYSRKTELSN